MVELHDPPSSATGVAFDGANIWVVNSFPNTVTKLRASDGTNLGEFAVGKVPANAAFDGEAIWVTDTQSTSITKLRASDGKVLGTFPDYDGPHDRHALCRGGIRVPD